MTTETISVYDMSKFESKLEAINKKARKIGLKEVKYTVIGDIEERDELWNELIIIGKRVEIVYEEIKMPGDWILIAILDHTENLILVMSDEYLPEEYKHRGNVCDHCHVNRQRNETFVIFNLNTDEYAQVGRTCLGEFLGIDASLALGQIDLIRSMSEDDEEFVGHRAPSAIKLTNYLVDVSAIIRRYGWLSTTAAKDSGDVSNATAYMAWRLYFGNLKDRNDKKVEIGHTEYDQELAENVVAWMNGLQDRYDLNEYLANLAQIAENDYVTAKSIGFAASAISAYQREIEKSIVKSGAYLGNVGDKIQVEATLLSARGYENNYGWQHSYIFVDDAGNTIKWNTQKTDLELNAKYNLRGRIKKLSVYNGVAQTEITNAKLQ